MSDEIRDASAPETPAPMSEPSGTYDCPYCGKDTPHYHPPEYVASARLLLREMERFELTLPAFLKRHRGAQYPGWDALLWNPPGFSKIAYPAEGKESSALVHVEGPLIYLDCYIAVLWRLWWLAVSREGGPSVERLGDCPTCGGLAQAVQVDSLHVEYRATPVAPPETPAVSGKSGSIAETTHEPLFFCNKCGYFGHTTEHSGCNYSASKSAPVNPLLSEIFESLRARNASLESELSLLRERQRTTTDAMQDDVLEMLRALMLSDAARPASPHAVVVNEVIPEILRLRERAETAERELESARRDTQRLDALEAKQWPILYSPSAAPAYRWIIGMMGRADVIMKGSLREAADAELKRRAADSELSSPPAPTISGGQ